jgi:hypothetical protein
LRSFRSVPCGFRIVDITFCRMEEQGSSRTNSVAYVTWVGIFTPHPRRSRAALLPEVQARPGGHRRCGRLPDRGGACGQRERLVALSCVSSCAGSRRRRPVRKLAGSVKGRSRPSVRNSGCRPEGWFGEQAHHRRFGPRVPFPIGPSLLFVAATSPSRCSSFQPTSPNQIGSSSPYSR